VTVVFRGTPADGPEAVPLPKSVADKIEQARSRAGRPGLFAKAASTSLNARPRGVKPSVGRTRERARCVPDSPIIYFVFMNDTIVSNSSNPQGAAWLVFSLLTVGCWGLYGAFPAFWPDGMQYPVNGATKRSCASAWPIFSRSAGTAGRVMASRRLVELQPGRGWAGRCWPESWERWAFGVLLAFGAKARRRSLCPSSSLEHRS